MTASDSIQEAFGFAGSTAVTGRFGHRRLTFFVDVDRAQASLRQSESVGPVLDRRLINALWEVHEGLEIPSAELPRWVVDRLSAVPVATPDGVIYRRLRPPLIVQGVAAAGRSLKRLLDDLGPFSAVCPAAAVVTGSEPLPSDPAFLDAQLFGVGVGLRWGHRIRVLSGADRVDPELGPYQWHLAEMLYSEMLKVS